MITIKKITALLVLFLFTVSIWLPFAPAFAAGTPVTIRIEGSGTTLFSGQVDVENCSVTDTASVVHTYSGVALCALVEAADQAGFNYVVQDFGFGLFLKQIGSDDTPADFSQSWSLWVNDASASVGADTLTVAANDSILLAFSAYPGAPLRIQLPTSPVSGESAQFTVQKLVSEFDANFNLQESWQAAAGATLHVGGSDTTVPANGIVTVTLPTAASVNISATGTGMIRSAVTSLTLVSPSPTVSPSPSPSASPTPSPSTSPSVSPSPSPSATPTPIPTPVTIVTVSQDDRQLSATKALQYLRSRQDSNGSIDGSVTSSWAAMAFGSNNERAKNISSGGLSLLDSMSQNQLSSATDIERMILAVRASGASPSNFAGQDLVALLKQRFNNKQIGEESLINDDIFGVLALIAADESMSSSIVDQTVNYIRDKQQSDGSWGNIDMTAAAIEALKGYRNKGGGQDINENISRARSYLKQHQDEWGGFGGNSATTAWTIQAIISLGENPNSWNNSVGKTPWHALLRYQNSSGAFGWQSTQDVSAFMTAYAVPALLGVSWPITNVSIQSVELVSPITVSYTPLPSPTTTIKPSPQVLGVTTSNTSSNVSPTESRAEQATAPTNSPDASITPSPVVIATSITSGPTIPVNETDRRFTFSLFGIVNIAVGVVGTRLLSKLTFL